MDKPDINLMHKPTLLTILAACLALLSLHAQDSILKNGDFERSLNEDKWLDGWFGQSVEPSPDQWVSTIPMEDGGQAVEIKGGPPVRYLSQDVRLINGEQTGKQFILRWQAKGQGTSNISALPRDVDGKFFKAASKAIVLTDTFETHELPVEIPEDAGFVRITLSPGESSAVIFDNVELVPASASN